MWKSLYSVCCIGARGGGRGEARGGARGEDSREDKRGALSPRLPSSLSQILYLFTVCLLIQDVPKC